MAQVQDPESQFSQFCTISNGILQQMNIELMPKLDLLTDYFTSQISVFIVLLSYSN